MVRISCAQYHKEVFVVPDDRPGEYTFNCTNWYYQTGFLKRGKDYSVRIKITVNGDELIKSRVLSRYEAP
jgi:hypothetical protein